MFNDIKLQAGCMVVILFMSIIYFRTRRIKSYSHIIFSISLATMIFNLIFDMVTVYTVNHLYTVNPFVNRICHICFLGSLIMEIFLCFLYSVVLVNEDDNGENGIGKRKLWILAVPVWIAWIGLISLPIRYVESPHGNYSWGPAVFTVHGTTILYIVGIIYSMARHWKQINSRKRFVVSLAFSVELVCLLLQSIYPEALISGFGLTLVNLAFFLVVESPDALLMESLRIEKIRADEANASKSRFLSTMSHEIRTPMNAIVGMTDIILREELPQNVKQYLNNIKNSGDALLTIINDILDISKIESGKLDIIEDNYEPLPMFQDLSMIFLNRIGDKPVELLYDIDAGMPSSLYGDSKRIRQVIINLMNNAIKFTDSGYVRLVVRTEKIDDEKICLKFEIQDSGQGIKEEDIGKLFSSYQQVDVKRNHAKEGTGLGLSICKQLVELMNGEIGVRSVYGQGSTFFFQIQQGIVDSKPAAYIQDENTDSSIGVHISSSIVRNQIMTLAETFNVSYTDLDQEPDVAVDIIITDKISSVTDKERQLAGLGERRLYVLNNPMTGNYLSEGAIVINKPIFSLNFCRIVNNDDMVNSEDAGEDLNFTAPDAHVLVVDDNEINRKVINGLLDPYKLNIYMAEDGKQACQMVQEMHFDIVFMDHMMPVMDGIEATAFIRNLEGEYYQNLPIIALSANATQEAQDIFTNAHMNAFVSKPVRIKELAKCLRSWLPEHLIIKQDKESGKHGSGSLKTLNNDAVNGDAEHIFDTEGLENIDGLDVEEGLKNCGSRELFVELMGDCCRVIEQNIDKLTHCLETGNIRDYTIEVHALKNTSRMIGAMELSQKFYRMEQLGNDENVEQIKEEFPELIKLYKSYEEILSPFCNSQLNGTEQITVENLKEKLMDLHKAVDCFDLDAADSILNQLESYEYSEEIKPVIKQLVISVREVDMEKVLELTDTLISMLGGIS